MPFQVTMFWDENVPHPAFAAREEAISYAIGLLAQLPEDASPNADVSVSNEDGTVLFNLTLLGWRFAVLAAKERAYTTWS